MSQLESAKARLIQAEVNLSYTEVKAPISGMTGTRLTDPGNLVNPGSPLVTITEIDPVYVEFSVPDMDMQRLKGFIQKGLPVGLLIGEKIYRYKR